MKIGIDATITALTSDDKSGIYHYILYLVSALLDIDTENEYILFFNFLKNKHLKGYREVCSLLKGKDNFRAVVSRFPPQISTPLRLPIDLFTGSVDVFHGPAHVIPPVLLGKGVITIHNTSQGPEFTDNPEWIESIKDKPHLIDWYKGRLRYFSYKNKHLPRSVKRADLIISISNYTKNDIIEMLGVPENKVKVVYHGVSPRFTSIEDVELLDAVKAKYNIEGSYILFVSTFNPNKNIIRLLEAFHELRYSSNLKHRLVLVGRKTWYYPVVLKKIQELQLEDIIICPGHITHEDLPAFYSGADLFICPSLLEGFGMPILEAMACGTPVVSSNAAALPEIVGDAGILVNPHSSEDLAEGMYRVLSNDNLKSELRNQGIKRAKLFTWEKTARDTLEAYKAVCKM